jgi:chaperone modulatory protein CbpM
MTTFEEILRLHRIQRVELTTWIEQRWVRPRETAGGYFFDEVDEARIELISELRRDLMVKDDVLDVVLSLLDQLYATRRMLRTVEEALETLPEPVRAQIKAKLREEP